MLVTRDNLKTFLGITDSSKDALLDLLNDQVSAMVEKKCGRTFDETVYTDEEYDGTSEKKLVLKQFPVTATTTFKLERNWATDNSDDWEEIDTDDYWVDNNEGIVTKLTEFLAGKQNYRATYSAGYGTIPYDLQYVVMQSIGLFLNKRRASGLKSETLGDHTVVFEGIIAENDNLYNMISDYRKIPL